MASGRELGGAASHRATVVPPLPSPSASRRRWPHQQRERRGCSTLHNAWRAKWAAAPTLQSFTVAGGGSKTAARITHGEGGSLRLEVSRIPAPDHPAGEAARSFGVHVDQVDVVDGGEHLLGADALFRLDLATMKQAGGKVEVSFTRRELSPARRRPTPPTSYGAIEGIRAMGAAALTTVAGFFQRPVAPPPPPPR